MLIEQADFVKEFIRVCGDGFRIGLHEHDGGNLSYRMRPEDVRQVKDSFSKEAKWQDLCVDAPGLGDEYLLITGAGKHFRNIQDNAADGIGIINIDEDGERFRVCWGLNGSTPAEGLATHLLNHDVKKHTGDGTHRVVYHCHPPNLTALTFVMPLESELFTYELWRTSADCAALLPEGVGVLDWMVPGKIDIAKATASLMEKHNAVIFAYHGLCVTAETLGKAFGTALTIEKAALIIVKVISMGGVKHGITKENLKELGSALGLSLYN